jgi:hypothetical protein
MAEHRYYELAIKIVKALVKSGKYRITDHAFLRMEERNIPESQIEEYILWGHVLQIQDHKRDIKLKIKSKTDDVFVIVTAQCDNSKNIRAIIITCAHTLDQLEDDWNKILAE